MKVQHEWTGETVTINVEGLADSIRMLHVTDAHVATMDDRDSEYQDRYEEYCRAHQSRIGIFGEMMASTKNLGVDVVALTGDIVAFPALAAIDAICDAISQVEVPVLFTCGNHDWAFGGLEGVREEIREAWWPTLEPLHHGRAASDRYEIGGIQFLLVDNSTYQIDEEQLAFVEEHLRNGMPTVFLMHIPVSFPTLRGPTLEMWNKMILMGDLHWDQDSRNKCVAGEDLPSTLEFIRVLETAENLVAVFCGHVHFIHTDIISPNATQYVGPAGYEGGKSLVEFRPF